MNASRVPLVGMSGRKSSGKDTAAGVLRDYGWELVAFAEPLKKMAYAINPRVLVPSQVAAAHTGGQELCWYQDVVDAMGLDAAKNQVPDVRRFLQRLGTEGVRNHLGKATWTDLAMGRYADTRAPGFAITDVRFHNELDALRSAGGIVVRVVRPSLPQPEDMHPSERALEGVEVDIELVNDSDIHTLQTRLLDALAGHGIALFEALAA